MPLMVVMVLVGFVLQPDEDVGERGKNIGLDIGHQQIDKVDKDRHQDKKERGAPAQAGTHGAKHKDQDDKAQDDDMARDHVGEKPDDERERLGENAEDLDRDHDRLNPEWHGRVNDMQPIVLAGAEHDRDKGQHPEGSREGDIADDVGRSGYQPQQCIDQDKKENSQQEGHVFLILVAEVDLGHLVPDENDDRLEKALHSAWGGSDADTLLVFFCRAGHDPHQQQDRDQHLRDIPAERKIKYPDGWIDRPVGPDRDDLAGFIYLFIQPVGRNIVLRQHPVSRISLFAMLEARSHEKRPAFLSAIQDDRQRDGNDAVVKGEKMKFVAVGNMLEDQSGRINFGRVGLPGAFPCGGVLLAIRHIKKKDTNYAESRYQ